MCLHGGFDDIKVLLRSKQGCKKRTWALLSIVPILDLSFLRQIHSADDHFLYLVVDLPRCFPFLQASLSCPVCLYFVSRLVLGVNCNPPPSYDTKIELIAGDGRCHT